MKGSVLVVLAVCVGCGSDPCDDFPDESCIALEVRGPGLAIDQVGVAAAGFVLSDGRSPSQPRALKLPVVVPVVPGGKFAGAFALIVRGFAATVVVGEDLVPGELAAGQHIELVANLVRGADAGVPDGASFDFARAPDDLAGRDLAGVDLAGADLSTSRTLVPHAEVSNTTHDFMGVFGFSPTNVYAVTLDGDIFRRGVDGTWKSERVGSGNRFLHGVWGTGADDVYAFGADWGNQTFYVPLLLHSTGNGQWGTAAFPGSDTMFAVNIESMGGTGRNDLYAGVSGVDAVKGIYRSVNDGATWIRGTTSASPTIQTADGVWAISPNDVYISSALRIFHSTGGNSWDVQSLPIQATTHGIWASAGNDIYEVGQDTEINPKSAIFHSTGNGTWAQQSTGTLTAELHAVFGSAADDIWVAGAGGTLLHSTGNGQWTRVTTGTTTTLRGVWATAGHAFIVGEGGVILHSE